MFSQVDSLAERKIESKTATHVMGTRQPETDEETITERCTLTCREGADIWQIERIR